MFYIYTTFYITNYKDL